MNISLETNVWGAILLSLKSKLSQQTFETWFRPIQLESLDDAGKAISLRAPNQVVRDWVVTHYSHLLNESLTQFSLEDYSLNWLIEKPPASSKESNTSSALSDRAMAASAAVAVATAPAVKVQKEEPAKSVEANPSPSGQPSLSSKYTFESFVVGSCNQFAHAASLAVAEAPGRT
ncbi:MAG TPA: DnaA N-terminal domain-containing protein, partial [Pyrinomonadaceae bacterium]